VKKSRERDKLANTQGIKRIRKKTIRKREESKGEVTPNNFKKEFDPPAQDFMNENINRKIRKAKRG